ncbi:MAG TPA: hypothetical protein VL614_15275 [Acetobacteraceae bacterium]|jgi:ribosome modulation factor|nr:hypothetical protein [Acetobacteraceae bacterium]
MADRLSSPEESRKSNLTPNTFLDFWEKWRAAKRQLGESSSEVMHIKKGMKGAGIDARAFDMMVKLNDLDPDEASTVIKSVLRYATWCGMPFATQSDLTRGMAIEKPDDSAKAKHDLARAKDDGYFAGKDGSKRRDENPFAGGSEGHVQWDMGWLEGQEVIARRMATGGGDGGVTQARPRGRPLGSGKKAAAAAAETKADDTVH